LVAILSLIITRVRQFYNVRILADGRDRCGTADACFAFHGELRVEFLGLGQYTSVA
jgi:hypothetical protein